MEQFQGAEKLIVQTIMNSPKDSAGYVADTQIATASKISVQDVQNWLETLEGKGFVQRAKTSDGFIAYVTAKGKQVLGLTPPDQESRVSDSSQTPIKVVPKGLRSYEEEDAYFFLELLPGTRDRDGLPESIRYWKIPIERTDADRTFRVGLIYGPSGCGKSSLVKAGLLPKLDHVLSVYVEAIPEGTEARLLNKLRNLGEKCPELPMVSGLTEMMATLSGGQVLPPGKKVLIVLDQFEQWLSTWRGDKESGLFAALRHCDGGHVQAIVLVRDDFWMAVNRFEKQLGVEFRRTLNSYGIDLFDPIHAKKVLMDFGRGFGQLPDQQEDFSDDQKAFLDQAVKEQVEKGKVVPVRLSLFAWMVRSKPWTTETLRDVGGAEGVGVNFLEETFGLPNAEPKYRLHQKAAQAVLKALLPEGGTRFGGRAKSYSELLSASGYAHRPEDFDVLCRILDEEVRLITHTVPVELSDGDWREPAKQDEHYYQLTHDYLVPSLRKWLSLKPLDDREIEDHYRRLLTTSPIKLYPIIEKLRPHKDELSGRLWKVLEQSDDKSQYLQAGSALALYDPANSRWQTVGGKVAGAMVTGNAVHLGFWLDALRPARDKLTAPLATIYRDTERPETERSLAFNILEDYASDQPNVLANLLMDSEGDHFARLFEKLKAHQEAVVPLLEEEMVESLPEATEVEKDGLDKRQARAAVAMIRLGRTEPVWPLLRHSPNPSLRSYLVNWLKPLGAAPKALLARMESLKSAQGRRQWTGDRRWTPSSSIPRPRSAGR